MIKIENTDVWGIEHSIRGMRNPKNSWDKSDSVFSENKDDFVIGKNDLKLMKTLINSGSEHRKFLRQIFVSCDITAPLYWWKEFDTYKIGTTADSCSTMHTIHKREFTLDDFSHEHLINFHGEGEFSTFGVILGDLNWSREKYLETKDKRYWWQMIQLLPSSYNQKRTWTGSYENLINMYRQRKNHKLDEWREFCAWIETLPYAKELIVENSND